MTTPWKVPAIDYTSRDFQAIRDDAIARILFFIEEWTDHTDRDPGIVLLELFAGMHDVLHWYIDRSLKEGFVPDVLGRRSMIALAALVGQRLIGKAPSVSNLDITLTSVQPVNTPVPTGTKSSTVSISPAVVFETTQSVVIPAGILTVTGVPITQGERNDGTLGDSTGEPYQVFEISTVANVLDDGIRVEVDSEEWDYVVSLIHAGPTEKVWTYIRDERGVVSIVFGNGSTEGGNGLIPPETAQIDGSWREGGGINTNVGVNEIRTITSTLQNDNGTPVTATCTNPQSAQGGDEEETVDMARRRVPRAWRSQNRAVNKQDMEGLAESVPGVVQSLALVNPAGVGQWTVYIAPHPSIGVGAGVDPFGYAVLSSLELSQQSLAQVVKNYLDERRMGTDGITVQVAAFRPIDATFILTLIEGANRADVERLLAEYVAGTFDVRNLRVGETGKPVGDINLGEFNAGLDDIKGVDFPAISKFQLRPQVETLAAIGEPLFTTITYTDHTRDAWWEVMFLDVSTFVVFKYAVEGSLFKYQQSNLGILDSLFTADNDEIQFLITLPGGNTPPYSGDRFRFRSSSIRQTIHALEGEVAAQGVMNYSLVGGI